MKSALFALSLFALSPFAGAAEATITCKVAVPSQPNEFKNELVRVQPALGDSRYVLVNKEFTAAEEISQEDYLKRKAEKFAGIEGQAVVVFQQESKGYVGITYGYTDGTQGKLVNGVTAFGTVGENHVVLFPLDRTFAAGCTLKQD